MTIDVDWTIKVGTVASPYDLTSYVAGMSIRQTVGYMEPSRQNVVITLNNFDGTFSPGTAGTYSNVDWFQQGVFITASVNSTYDSIVFNGLVDDIIFNEDRSNPTVTITAVDWLTIGSRALAGYNFTYVGDIRWTTAANGTVQQFLRGASAGAPATLFQLPALGQDYGDVVEGGGASGGRVQTNVSYIEVKPEVATNDSLGDYLTILLGGVPGAIWPTYIEEETDSSANPIAFYRWEIIGEELTRNVFSRIVYKFDDAAADTLASGELPIATLRRGFEINELINQAAITSDNTGNTETNTNQTSVNDYGVRTYRANKSLIIQDVMLQSAATQIVNRASTTRFVARNLQFDTALLAEVNSGSADELANLLDVSTGLWQPADVTFTPIGGSTPITETALITGRTIQAVPGRTTITLDLLPAQDYQSFVLDSDTLGVLDTNRLG